jgi:hypothetical protein
LIEEFTDHEGNKLLNDSIMQKIEEDENFGWELANELKDSINPSLKNDSQWKVEQNYDPLQSPKSNASRPLRNSNSLSKGKTLTERDGPWNFDQLDDYIKEDEWFKELAAVKDSDLDYNVSKSEFDHSNVSDAESDKVMVHNMPVSLFGNKNSPVKGLNVPRRGSQRLNTIQEGTNPIEFENELPDMKVVQPKKTPIPGAYKDMNGK